LIQILAAGTIQLDGLMSVNGVSGTFSEGFGAGGGSGGGIYLRCNRFQGIGRMEANGGNGGVQSAGLEGGGGGGGRIAVWSIRNAFTGTTSVTNGTSVAAGSKNGYPGTLVFISQGTVIMIR
jgi:hypothetical protein